MSLRIENEIKLLEGKSSGVVMGYMAEAISDELEQLAAHPYADYTSNQIMVRIRERAAIYSKELDIALARETHRLTGLGAPPLVTVLAWDKEPDGAL